VTDEPARQGNRHHVRRQGEPLRLRWILAPLGLLVLAWLAVCAVTVADAYGKLRGGVGAITQVKANLHTSTLEDGQTAVPLRLAVGRFGSADSLLSEPWMAPLDVAPYVGRQLHSARSLASAAHSLTAAGSTALDRTQALLRSPLYTPAARAALLTELRPVVTPLATKIDHIDLGPSDALFPTLASKRATFAGDLARLRDDLDRGSAALQATTDLINGPRTYLVFAANNAEMRAGSGDYLEVGTLTSSRGSLTFGSFSPTDELANPASTVPLTGDMATLWGDLSPQKDYRDLSLTPQFPANAALAAQMWQAQTGQKVDGVLVVDVDGLRSILSATGPVSAGGQTVDAASVDELLLEQQYVGQDGDGTSTDARHDQLGVLAATIFDQLQGSGTSVTSLATALAQAAAGRHLVAWSSNPSIETAWQASGAGGTVAPDGVLLSLINDDANKLDPYQQIAARLTTARDGRDTRLTVAVTFTNQTPPGLSSYAAQGGDGALPAGSYVGTATLDFPGTAGLARVDRAAVAVQGHDYGSDVIGVPVQLTPGQSTTVTWTFVLSGAHGQVLIEPSARVPPVTWQGPHGMLFTDADAHAVAW
jgi:hypothetical protein